MGQFAYAAIQDSGRRIRGRITSSSRYEALRQLRSMGYHPLSVEPTDGRASDLGQLLRRPFRRVPLTALAVFTRQLAALMKAGLPIVSALRALRQQCPCRELVRVVQTMEEALSRDGGSLSQAMAAHPRVFDPVYRGLVRAGEEGGNLVEVLDRMAEHLARSSKLRGQVLGAFAYPLFLLIMGSAAVFVLMAFVIPRFQEMFATLDQTLPLPTRVLIAVSSFLAQWWWLVLAGLVTSALAAVAVLRIPVVRNRADRAVLRLPVFGPMFLKLEVSRLARTLAALLTSGVHILEGLRVTQQTVRNRAVRATFGPIVHAVGGGESLTEAMAKARLYPPMMISLARTGEDTGELPEMLGEIAGIYEQEAERAVNVTVKLLEPALIVAMGAVIAGIVAAVMLPIFEASALAR